MRCVCDVRTYFREVAIYTERGGVVVVLCACDSCDEGIAAIEFRLSQATAAAKGGTVRPQVRSLRQLRADLDRDVQGGSRVQWRLDPAMRERYTDAENERIDALPPMPGLVRTGTGAL